MHFYDFNIGDYAKKTQHLTNEEDIAYRRALDLYYDTEQPLPITQGLATLARRLRVGIEALKVVVDEFFPEGRNKHCDEVIANYYAFLERQKANGKLGGRPKHKGLKPSANPPVSQNNPVPSQPLPTTHLPLPKEKLLSEYSDDFMKAWSVYPKRPGMNKKDSYKAWSARIKNGADASVMIAGVERYALFCKIQRTEEKFIKQPATFFGPSEHYLCDWKVSNEIKKIDPSKPVVHKCEHPGCNRDFNLRTSKGYRCTDHMHL